MNRKQETLLSLGVCWVAYCVLAFAAGGMTGENPFWAAARWAIPLLLPFGVLYGAGKKGPLGTWGEVTASTMFLGCAGILCWTLLLLEGISQWLGGAESLPKIPVEQGWVALLVIYGVFTPLVEEIVFRKWLLSAAAPLGLPIGVFLSSFLFSMGHGGGQARIYSFVAGACFACLYLWRGKVWHAMALHSLFNGAAIGFAFFPETEWWILTVASLCLTPKAAAFAVAAAKKMKG